MKKIVVSSEEELMEMYWSLVLKRATEFMNDCLQNDSFSVNFKNQNKDSLFLKIIMFELAIIQSYILAYVDSSFGPRKSNVSKTMVNNFFKMASNKYKDNYDEFKKLASHTSAFEDYSHELWTDLQNRQDQFFFPKSSQKALEILFDTKDKIEDFRCILKVFDHAQEMLFNYHEIGKNIVFKSDEQSKPFWKIW